MDRHKAKKGDRIGLEFQINDADASGARIGTLSWNDETGMGWSKSSVYGTIELAAEAKDEVSDDNSKPGTDDPSTGNTEKPGTGKPAINKPSADKPATGSTNKPLANKPAAKKLQRHQINQQRQHLSCCFLQEFRWQGLQD